MSTSPQKPKLRLPKPTAVRCFGRGFDPASNDPVELVAEWQRRFDGALSDGELLFSTSFSLVVASDPETFVRRVEERLRAAHGDFVKLDLLRLDQASGRDIAFVVLWNGEAAQEVQKLLDAYRREERDFGHHREESRASKREAAEGTAQPSERERGEAREGPERSILDLYSDERLK